MPTTISKVKPKIKPALVKNTPKVKTVAEMSDEELVDHFGKLDDDAKALMKDPTFTLLDEAKSELLKRLDEYEPDDEITIKGEDWQVEAGACKKAPRKITDMKKIVKLMGEKTFLQVAKVTLGDAQKYLTQDQLETVVGEEEYSKNRTIKTSYLGGE